MSCLKIIGIVAGILVLITSFILSIVIYTVVSDNNGDSKVAIQCMDYETRTVILEMTYDIMCDPEIGDPTSQDCIEMKEEIDKYTTYIQAFLDTYNAKECLDIWPQ